MSYSWQDIAITEVDLKSPLNDTFFGKIRNCLYYLYGVFNTPAGHINGGIASISSDTEIEMSALYAVDSEGAEVIEIAAQTLDITVAADWIAGSVPASYTDLTIHVFAGLKTGESTAQFYLSESASPTGFDYYRYVGSYLCDSAGDLLYCNSYGTSADVKVIYSTLIDTTINKSSSWVRTTLPIPTGFKFGVIGVAEAEDNSGSGTGSIGDGDSAVELFAINFIAGNVFAQASVAGIINTDTSARIYSKAVSDISTDQFNLSVSGYEIRR